MSNSKYAIIASALAASLYSQAAYAGETKPAVSSTQTTARVTVTPNTTVLSSADAVTRVEDEKGRVFYNQFVPESKLQAVDDVDANNTNSETYQFEYKGRTYTNKIVG